MCAHASFALAFGVGAGNFCSLARFNPCVLFVSLNRSVSVCVRAGFRYRISRLVAGLAEAQAMQEDSTSSGNTESARVITIPVFVATSSLLLACPSVRVLISLSRLVGYVLQRVQIACARCWRGWRCKERWQRCERERNSNSCNRFASNRSGQLLVLLPVANRASVRVESFVKFRFVHELLTSNGTQTIEFSTHRSLFCCV